MPCAVCYSAACAGEQHRADEQRSPGQQRPGRPEAPAAAAGHQGSGQQRSARLSFCHQAFSFSIIFIAVDTPVQCLVFDRAMEIMLMTKLSSREFTQNTGTILSPHLVFYGP